MNDDEGKLQVFANGREPIDLIADQLPEFVWMTAPEGMEVTYINKPYLDFLGLSSVEQFLGKAWEHYVHPADLTVVTRIHDVAYKERKSYNIEARFRRRDSMEYHWFLIHGLPRFDQSGRFSGFIGTAIDISAFKKEVGKNGTRTGAIEELARRVQLLQHSNEYDPDIARVTRYDLRQPVRKVQLYLGMFLIQLDKGFTKEAVIYLRKAQETADRMANTIEGILDYSISDAESAMEVIALNPVLDQILTDFDVQVRAKNVVFGYGSLPDLWGRPFMIYQLFFNLLSNALKFVKRKGPTMIRISGSRDREAPGAVVNGSSRDYVRISVKDCGIGFPQVEAVRIFAGAVRLHPGQYEGKGIRLALCKMIVQQHGGTIEAISHTEGVEFIVCLPSPVDIY